MPYPGAPILEKRAKSGKIDKTMFPYGQNRKIEDDPDFSFSGLKTSLRYRLEKMSGAEIEAAMPDLCASYQFAVIEQLRRRCDWFAKRKPYKSLGISGGVSNNSVFAGVFEKLARSRNAKFLIADRQHRGDNAAMIAFAAWIAPSECQQPKNSTLEIRPAWELCKRIGI